MGSSEKSLISARCKAIRAALLGDRTNFAVCSGNVELPLHGSSAISEALAQVE